MGAGISGMMGDGCSRSSETSIGELPENCVALILSRLEATQICGLAAVNPTFRRASSSDAVWDSKLPHNYHFLLNNLFAHNTISPNFNSKKQIFATLSRPTRFGGGYKELWLEKNGGGICVSVSWKEMKITGIDDRRYWTHVSDSDESRFSSIAYLKQIWWVEVEGSLELEFLPAGIYSLFFRLHLGKPSKKWGRRVCDVEQVHGWNMKPVRFQLSSSHGQQLVSCEYYLNNQPAGKWIHYHVGDFFVVDNSHLPTNLNFSMTQIDCTHTKGGMCLDSVFICPIKLGENFKNHS
nr:F-box protein PP2-A13-like [Ipomoea batatas]